MHFCTPVAVNPWIVFHIATCGDTRLHNENSLPFRLTSECENRPKTNDLVNGGDVFLIQPPHEKQAFLRLVLKSAAWRHGELQTQFEEPFENLRRSNQLSRRKENEIGGGATRNEI